MMTDCYGIDGSKAGWVICHYSNQTITFNLCLSLNDFLFKPNAHIVIDMPVQCPSSIRYYPRVGNISAKKRLGRWHSRVFYAPLLSWLKMDYFKINQICDSYKKPKLSKQSFNLFKKIEDVQEFVNQNSTFSIKESHPELVFQHLNQGLALESKKSDFGREQRLHILKSHLPAFSLDCINIIPGCVTDDLLDAAAMLWAAISSESELIF